MNKLLEQFLPLAPFDIMYRILVIFPYMEFSAQISTSRKYFLKATHWMKLLYFSSGVCLSTTSLNA